MSQKKKWVVISLLFFLQDIYLFKQVMAADKKKNQSVESKEIKEIKKVLHHYQKSSGVGIKIEKKVHLALLDETRTGQGELQYAKGRLRLEMDKPDSSLLVVDGRYVWLETRLGIGADDRVQVIRMQGSKITKANALLALLFGDERLWDKLKVTQVERDAKDRLEVILKPQSAAHILEVEKMKIVIRLISREILAITYWDELENETTYQFSNTKFDIKIKDRVFRYTPPTDAQVTHL